MLKFVMALAVMAAFAVESANAQHPHKSLLTTQTVALDSRSGAVVPTVTQLHPVVGSIQRRGHFVNPITHKARYSMTVYNPLMGNFSTRKFRR